MLICASIIRISIQDGHEQRGHVCTPSNRFVAFNSDVCEENVDELLSFKTWCIQQSSKVPQIKYWQTVYDMDMLLLRFVRSVRTEDLFLYEKSLDEIADWVFILDHYNYARWLTVHVRDMMNVLVKHPALYRQFADGFFTIAKTQNPFAMIGFDQTNEQQNKELKMHGGTLNLSDECVFTKWAVAGPEIARVITEFEAGMYRVYAEECRSQAS